MLLHAKLLNLKTFSFKDFSFMQNQRLVKTLFFFKDLNKNFDMMSLFLKTLKTFKDFKDPWGP